MFRRVFRFFDRLEDKVRAALSKHPVVYTIIGGFAIVLFWRGVWGITDSASEALGITAFWSNVLSVIISVSILLLTGLFVSFFIGERVIISGIKEEKKIFEKTADEVREEEGKLGEIEKDVHKIEKDIEDIKKAYHGGNQ